jgi:hypothetical protein
VNAFALPGYLGPSWDNVHFSHSNAQPLKAGTIKIVPCSDSSKLLEQSKAAEQNIHMLMHKLPHRLASARLQEVYQL